MPPSLWDFVIATWSKTTGKMHLNSKIKVTVLLTVLDSCLFWLFLFWPKCTSMHGLSALSALSTREIMFQSLIWRNWLRSSHSVLAPCEDLGTQWWAKYRHSHCSVGALSMKVSDNNWIFMWGCVMPKKSRVLWGHRACVKYWSQRLLLLTSHGGSTTTKEDLWKSVGAFLLISQNDWRRLAGEKQVLS